MEKINIYENIRRKLNFGEKVSSKEYLYALGVTQMPELGYLQQVEGDVFTDKEARKCKKSLRESSPEGYVEAQEQYRLFKEKDKDTLTELAKKQYENVKRDYDKKKAEIDYNKNLVANTEKYLLNFGDFPEFQKKSQELLDNLKKNLKEAEEKLEEPKLETAEEYRERVCKSYEYGLEEYKKVLEKEKNYTIEGINEFVEKFIGVLNGIKEDEHDEEDKN